MAKRKKLNYEVLQRRIFDRIHKTGEQIKLDLPNALRRVIEVEMWRHFTDDNGEQFGNIAEWLHYHFPNGCSMATNGEGNTAITYVDAMNLTQESAPDVYKVLAKHAPKAKPGRPKIGPRGPILDRCNRVGADRKQTLAARLAEKYPKYFDAYQAGKYKTIRAAAEAAGLVQPGHDPLKRLKSYWKKADAKQRAEFRKWLRTKEAK